jgi:hypothetical protein
VFAFFMQTEQVIVVDQKSPGGSDSPQGVVLFDGVCVLCSRGCHFVSKRDRRGYFRFVPIHNAQHGFGFYITLTVRDEGKGIRAIRIDPELVSKRTSLGQLARASALAVDMGLPLHPTDDPRRDLRFGRAQPLSLVRPS